MEFERAMSTQPQIKVHCEGAWEIRVHIQETTDQEWREWPVFPRPKLKAFRDRARCRKWELTGVYCREVRTMSRREKRQILQFVRAMVGGRMDVGAQPLWEDDQTVVDATARLPRS